MAANTLGRYHIIRELARSNDIVYEAMDPAQGKKIALKELQVPPNLTGQARRERIDRFTREARAAARLRHPNIVSILDHNQVGGRYYIAMEFLQGQSLRDVLRQRGALPVSEALRIGAAVADGLDYAHKNGVVHRDIKPDNVHLEPDGRVVITDFGIARLTFEPSLTADGQIFGTPSYMSPEQVTGKGIERRSDIFSLGVMLYEMVAGKKPFTGDSVITITYNIMNREAPPLANAPAGLDAIIRRAMDKDPTRRYSTGAELAEDLRLVAAGRPPRYTSAAPAASRAPMSAPRSAPPMPAPAPTPPRPPVPVAPMGHLPPLPNPRPVAGARPMPLPPVAAASPRNGSRGSVAVASAGAIPSPVPVYRPAPRQDSSGSDFKWLLGWLGVALIVGFLILTVVWAVVTSFDKYREQNSVRLRLEQKDQAVRLVDQAEAALNRGQPGEAEDLARRALQQQPGFAPALLRLARAVSDQRRTDEALPLFDETVAAGARASASSIPDNEKQEALAAVRDARQWKSAALYQDGERLLQSGNRDMARKRFEAVIATNDSDDFARQARAHLQQLGSTSGGTAPTGAPQQPFPPGSATSDPVLQPQGWDPRYKGPITTPLPPPP